MEFEFIDRVPTVSEYLKLRESVGWHALPSKAVEIGLARSLYSVCIKLREESVGCGRIVGDAGIYFYVQDVIVRPQYQQRGLGTRIMEKLMGYVGAKAQSGAFIGLMTAPGLEGFYGRFGFSCFPADSPGMLIWK